LLAFKVFNFFSLDFKESLIAFFVLLEKFNQFIYRVKCDGLFPDTLSEVEITVPVTTAGPAISIWIDQIVSVNIDHQIFS